MSLKKLLIPLFILIISSFANDKISVQLVWKHQFEFAGFYMAKEKGFYKDAGLDVELKEFNFGIDITQEVVEGKSTYGVNYPSVILEHANGSPVVILNAILQSSPHVLVTLKSSGIRSIEDFKDKKIMIFNNAIKSASLRSMLNSQGVSVKDMKLLPSKFNIDTLLDGTTDIKSCFLSNEVYELKQKRIKYDIWDPKDYGFDFYEGILFTSKKEIEENPQRVKSFQDATLKGWEYAFEHIDETIEVILKKYNSQHKTKKALRYEAEVLRALAYYKVDKIGTIDKNKIQRIYDIYNIMGLTKNKLNMDDMIFDEGVQSLNLSTKEKNYLKNKKQITMCVDPDWAPFEKLEDHKHIGIAADYIKYIQKTLPVPIKVLETKSWLESIEFAKQRKCDIFSLAMKTPQRTDYMNFTSPYLKIPMVMATKTGVSYVEDISKLKDEKIALIKGYASSDILVKRYKNIDFIEVKTLDEGLKLVAAGKVFGVIENLAVITNKIEQEYIGMLQISAKLKEKFELGIGARNDEPLLVNIFEKSIKNISEETNINIMQKWLPVSILDGKQGEKQVNLTKNQKEYLKNKKIIKMCNNPTWAPIEFSTEIFDNQTTQRHNMQGIAIDTLKLLEAKLNVKFEHIHTKDWGESQQFLKDGKCDILPAAIETKKRKEYAIFTEPYLSYELAVITKSGHPIVYNFDDMLNKTMARKKASGLIQTLKNKYPTINILETENTKEAFLSISNGEADYTVAVLPVASYYISKLAINNLQISGYLDMRYDLSIAVKKNEPILREILDEALKTITWKEKKDITDKWTKSIIKEITNMRLVWQTLGVVFVIILLLLYRQYTLGKYNKKLKQTKLELENSLKEIQHIIDTTIEGLIILEEGKCINVNNEVVSLFGFKDKQEIIGLKAIDFIAPQSRSLVEANMLLEKSEPYEVMAIKKDGSVFPTLLRGQNFYTEQKSMRIVGILDLSEVKQKDKLIADQSKMAAMGEMIGNIAHQWRQPLSVISVAASSMKMKSKFNKLEPEEIQSNADSIVKSTKYLSQTIDDFRDFIKGSKTPRKFDINTNIKRDLSILEGMLKANDIEVVLELEKDLEVVNYENELTQAVINIMNNSKDALKISNLERKLIFIQTYKKENYCYINIKDNANGINENIIDKIFEPYFTTKHQSQGTGLGLFMTHKILTESMQGDIKVYNKKYTFEGISYKGALFQIKLPL